MNLYLLVWQFEDIDRECEWTHFVSDTDYFSTDDEHKVIHQFMRDNHEEEPDDYIISESWCNKVTEQDGYTIKLEKVEANAKA